MEHHVLIMETHELLYVLKFRMWLVLHRAIVKTMKKPLELRDDGILVVAWITNQRAGGIRAITRQICRPYLRLSRVDGFPQQKGFPVCVVHVRLIVRPAPINVVEVKSRSSKIGQRIRVILCL